MIFVRRHDPDRLEIQDAHDEERMAGGLFREIQAGQVRWATVEAGRRVVFQDDYGHRLVYDTVAYNSDHGWWELRRVS
jgi:hypothetical protein